MRTKGEVERDISTLGYQNLAIHRPGLLEDRDNDKRIGEKILSVIPFITKIPSSDMGLAMLDHAIVQSLTEATEKKQVILSNSDLIEYARDIKRAHGREQ